MYKTNDYNIFFYLCQLLIKLIKICYNLNITENKFMKKTIIFLFLLSILMPLNVFAAEASLFLISGAGVYQRGKDINVRLIVNSGGANGINASGASMKFDPRYLTIKKITKDNSIFKHWPVEPKFSNKDGYFSVAGGAPGAYKDSAGTIINITLSPIKYGKTYINFDPANKNASTTVLSADGYGTNILKYPRQAVYIIGTATDVQNALNFRRGLSGRIMLEVQKKGEAWYLYPNDLKRYYLGRPSDAFAIMRKLGLGAKDRYIKTYISKTFPKAVWGKILINVEDKGKAYYINPVNKKGYYLGRPSDAFRIMRELGLGITTNDIDKIPDWAI